MSKERRGEDRASGDNVAETSCERRRFTAILVGRVRDDPNLCPDPRDRPAAPGFGRAEWPGDNPGGATAPPQLRGPRPAGKEKVEVER